MQMPFIHSKRNRYPPTLGNGLCKMHYTEIKLS